MCVRACVRAGAHVRVCACMRICAVTQYLRGLQVALRTHGSSEVEDGGRREDNRQTVRLRHIHRTVMNWQLHSPPGGATLTTRGCSTQYPWALWVFTFPATGYDMPWLNRDKRQHLKKDIKTDIWWNSATDQRCTPAFPKPIPAKTLARCILERASRSSGSRTALGPGPDQDQTSRESRTCVTTIIDVQQFVSKVDSHWSNWFMSWRTEHKGFSSQVTHTWKMFTVVCWWKSESKTQYEY